MEGNLSREKVEYLGGEYVWSIAISLFSKWHIVSLSLCDENITKQGFNTLCRKALFRTLSANKSNRITPKDFQRSLEDNFYKILEGSSIKKCECGGSSVGTTHSSWCPLY